MKRRGDRQRPPCPGLLFPFRLQRHRFVPSSFVLAGPRVLPTLRMLRCHQTDQAGPAMPRGADSQRKVMPQPTAPRHGPHGRDVAGWARGHSALGSAETQPAGGRGRRGFAARARPQPAARGPEGVGTKHEQDEDSVVIACFAFSPFLEDCPSSACANRQRAAALEEHLFACACLL